MTLYKNDSTNSTSHKKGKQGFASMNPKKQEELASKGGKSNTGANSHKSNGNQGHVTNPETDGRLKDNKESEE